jgi:hypothetical protein
MPHKPQRPNVRVRNSGGWSRQRCPRGRDGAAQRTPRAAAWRAARRQLRPASQRVEQDEVAQSWISPVGGSVHCPARRAGPPRLPARARSAEPPGDAAVAAAALLPDVDHARYLLLAGRALSCRVDPRAEPDQPGMRPLPVDPPAGLLEAVAGIGRSDLGRVDPGEPAIRRPVAPPLGGERHRSLDQLGRRPAPSLRKIEQRQASSPSRARSARGQWASHTARSQGVTRTKTRPGGRSKGPSRLAAVIPIRERPSGRSERPRTCHVPTSRPGITRAVTRSLRSAAAGAGRGRTPPRRRG